MELVDRVVPADSLMAAAHEAANQFLGMSREVLASQKNIVAKWLELREEESAEFTIKEFVRIFDTAIPHEGMPDFLEKRATEFEVSPCLRDAFAGAIGGSPILSLVNQLLGRQQAVAASRSL